MVTNLFMFGPEAGSLSADLTPVGPTGRQLEVVQKDVLAGGFRPLETCLVQTGPLSLVQECRDSSLIGRELP